MGVVYLVFREIKTGDGAALSFLIGSAATRVERAQELASLMNDNKNLAMAARMLDCEVRHYVMEVEVE